MYADIECMRRAVEALSEIPTTRRRRIALDWIIARVSSDIDRLALAERNERIGEAVEAIIGQ